MEKQNKKLRPLSRYMSIKPFFPNFVDPVPPGFTLKTEADPLDDERSEQTQGGEAIQSNVSVTPEKGNENEAVFVQNKVNKNLLQSLFNDVCADIIFREQGCMKAECEAQTHQLPSVELVAKKLEESTALGVQNALELILLFPDEQRRRYFPALAKVYAQNSELHQMESLIKHCQKSPKTISCFENVVDALSLSGWSYSESLKFLIDNHKDTEESRKVILSMIGSTGNDVIKFIDYLNMIRSN